MKILIGFGIFNRVISKDLRSVCYGKIVFFSKHTNICWFKYKLKGFYDFTQRNIAIGQYVVYWPPTPPNMPFQRRRKCIFNWRGRACLTLWDRVKISRYSHKTDAPEESDLWTAWQLFPLDDDQTCHSKDGRSDTFRWPVMGRYWVGVCTII